MEYRSKFRPAIASERLTPETRYLMKMHLQAMYTSMLVGIIGGDIPEYKGG